MVRSRSWSARRRPDGKQPGAKRLAVESLERRELLAGNVGVTLRSGLLTVTGDGGANQVTIYQQANGRFTVAGLDSEVFTGATTNLMVRSIQVNLGGGNDSVTIAVQPDVEAEELLPAAVLGTVNVNGGAGEDTIAVSVVGRLAGEVPIPNVAVTIDGGAQSSGAQADVVVVSNSATGILSINTWGGDDIVEVDNTLSLTASINAGDGSDIVTLTETAALTGNLLLGSAAANGNVLTVDTGLFGTLNVTGGNGIDDVALLNTLVGMSLNVSTLGGADVVALTEVQTGLTPGDVQEFAAELIAAFDIDISQLPFDFNALIARVPGLPGILNVNTGEGNDVVVLTDVASTLMLTVLLGGGNDDLIGTNVEAVFGQLNGGAGTDDRLLDAVDTALLVLLFEGTLTPPNMET